MAKAKYIGKSYDRFSDAVYLFYEYRGHEYMICDEHNGYSEPMYIKHRIEQNRIDQIIEEKNRPQKGEPVDLDEIWEMLGWND